MGSTYSKIILHFVFSTKNREPLISRELEPRLFEYIGGIVRGEGGTLIAAGGDVDHVHLLVAWRHDASAADLMRAAKSNSTKWVKKSFPALATFRWQEGYGVFSVSTSQVDKVKSYIAGQHEHHQRVDFKAEYRKLLKSHGIVWDEEYAWD
jgi:REP element-mobilizing transposase RayT